VVPQLLAALGGRKPPKPAAVKKSEPYQPSDGPLRVDDLARALRSAVGDRAVTLTHLPLSWNGATWPFRHPLDYLGSEGGGGVGGGPGNSIGAALALKGTGRLPVAVCGDGDFMMGATAIWTAVHYRIPLLFVVCNNRSFFNDELHQERVARIRNRPVENRWIGQRISEPDIDCAGVGRAQRSGRDLREGYRGGRARPGGGGRRARRARLFGSRNGRHVARDREEMTLERPFWRKLWGTFAF
jgi:hypothetical protein